MAIIASPAALSLPPPPATATKSAPAAAAAATRPASRSGVHSSTSWPAKRTVRSRTLVSSGPEVGLRRTMPGMAEHYANHRGARQTSGAGAQGEEDADALARESGGGHPAAGCARRRLDGIGRRGEDVTGA